MTKDMIWRIFADMGTPLDILAKYTMTMASRVDKIPVIYPESSAWHRRVRCTC